MKRRVRNFAVELTAGPALAYGLYALLRQVF